MNTLTIPDKKTRENGLAYHEKIVWTYQNLVTLLKQEIEKPEISPLERARIEVELMEREDALKFKQQAYNIYAERVQGWQKAEEQAIQNCNRLFDEMLKTAKEIKGVSDLDLLIKVVETNTQRVETDAHYKLNLFNQINALVVKHAKKIKR